MTSTTGGQDRIERFSELVKAASENGFDVAFRCNLMKEAVSDFRDNNLVNTCLLQYPYGRGGMQEKRINSNGSIACGTDVEEYVKHVSRLSQPHFHHELFSLILYNLSMKQAMVRTAGWRVRNKTDAHALAEELTVEEVSDAIRSKSRIGGTSSDNGYGRGRKVLDAVDAIARSVPHTNEAARQARRRGEAMQHQFGTASYFLTVTPDDDNCFLVQVYAGEIIDDDRPVASQSDAELAARAKKRTTLRLKFPGICAFFFESALEIIVEDVIGWDLKKKRARTDGAKGLFGEPVAFVAAVEEQGRGTLHVHIQIWVKGYNERREELHSENRALKRKATEYITSSYDHVGSSSLVLGDVDDNGRRIKARTAFDHDCAVKDPNHRQTPLVVDDQALRHLRYKEGVCGAGGYLAYCPHCTMTWSSEELVGSYLINGVKVPGLTSFPDHDAKRLKAMAVQYQKSRPEESLKTCVIDAAYNLHSHTNTSCFGKIGSVKGSNENNKSRKRKVPSRNYECRYRHPQRKKQRTVVQNASESPVFWYNWDGTRSERFIKEICIRRRGFDAFQNICCAAISHSKLTCNTNVAPIMPGPVAQYSFKYNIKETQEQDTEDYGLVQQSMQKTLSKPRTHESDRSEAVKRLLAGSFAHLKTNVCRATMARFLTWMKTRFIFSHETVWAPLRDMEMLLKGGAVTASVLHHGRLAFFQCSALHYLCRPIELENVNAWSFFSNFEVIRVTSDNKHDLLEFFNDGIFKHPSFCKSKNGFLQGVRERTVPHIVQVYQYDFPDSAEFGGCLLDVNHKINANMEQYSKLALLLFCPYRQVEEITVDGSYTLRLREAVADGIIGESAKKFLQNLQDTKSNSFRVTRLQDDLERNTERLHHESLNHEYLKETRDGEADDFEIDDGVAEGHRLDEFLKLLEMEAVNDADCDESDLNNTMEFETNGANLPELVSLERLRDKGSERCGYEWLANMKVNVETEPGPILEVEMPTIDDAQEQSLGQEVTPDAQDNEHQVKPTQFDIVTVILSKVRRRKKSFSEITGIVDEVEVLEANGTAWSIVDWGRKARLDDDQKKAFEIITSTFILSFFKEAAVSRGVRHKFVTEKEKLRRLARVPSRSTEQLICLLHGPGGCGKTTVIDLVMTYAAEYCSYLKNFKFTSRTIIVTAMTGVAATILLGETTHSAVYLNQTKPIQAEQVELWSETRLIIIDEISFASRADFEEMHKKMRLLKQKLDQRYGGVNVVFSGDMRQLEPVGRGKKPVYEENCPEFKDWVNCYIELRGMHRFRDDPEWGELLLRFRAGSVTLEDIDKINERVARGNMILPEDIKYATFYNRDRDSINAALFEERLKLLFKEGRSTNDSVMIFSDQVKVQNGTKTYVPLRNCASFWENCAEDDVKMTKSGVAGRMDPVLRLYHGCCVMLPCNSNVKEGQANGTQATVERVVLKHGEYPQEVLIGGNVPIAAVSASQVSYVLLRHSNNRVRPATFKVSPKEHCFTGNMLKPKSIQVKGQEREALKMKATQVPIIINNATTGHKLQGSGVDSLFVHDWSYRTNWVYVMLSRVKTRVGLFCRKPLSRDLNRYKVPDALQRMLDHFRTKAPENWSDDDYEFELQQR